MECTESEIYCSSGHWGTSQDNLKCQVQQCLQSGEIHIEIYMLLIYSEDKDRAWENIKENIKTSAKESLGLYKLKQHKPWFDDECLHFFRSNETG